MFYFLVGGGIVLLLIALFVFLRLAAWDRYELLEQITRDLSTNPRERNIN